MELLADRPEDIQVEIRTFDSSQVLPPSFHRGTEIPLEHEVRLRFLGTERYLGPLPDLMVFAVELPINIAAGLISAALWEFLKRVLGSKAAQSIEIVVNKTPGELRFKISSDDTSDQVLAILTRILECSPAKEHGEE